MRWKCALACLLAAASIIVTACTPATTAQASSRRTATTDNQRKDATWVADPVNYEVTKKPHLDSTVSVPILEYHEAKYEKGNALTLKPGQFRSEVEWLHSRGFHTINFGQLYAAMYYGYKLPPRPVLLTFDDGYESVYLDVYPVLKKYRYQATCFVISGYVKDKPNRSVSLPKLTTGELKQLQASGVIDIESHTVHHVDLSKVSSTTARKELQGSAAALEKMVGHPIKFFCYPFGQYTSQVVPLVRSSGYLMATTEHCGYAHSSENPLTLSRIPVYSSDTLSSFAGKLSPSLFNPNK